MKNYYYSDGSEQAQGPLSLAELDALHRAGRIDSTTQVCEEGTENWTQFFQVVRPAEPRGKLINKRDEEKPKEVIKSEPKHKKSEFEGVTKSQGSFLIILLLIGIGAPFWVFLKPVPKWEYTIAAPSDSEFESMMATYGDNGWEVVSTRRAMDDGKGIYECIMKRPKR